MNKCGINIKLLLQMSNYYCGAERQARTLCVCVCLWWDGYMWANWCHDNFLKCNFVWNVRWWCCCREWQFKYILFKTFTYSFILTYILCNENLSMKLLLFFCLPTYSSICIYFATCFMVIFHLPVRQFDLFASLSIYFTHSFVCSFIVCVFYVQI